MLAHQAVERRPDLGIVQIQLRDFDLPLGVEDARLGSRLLVDPVIDFGRRRRVFMKKVGVSRDLGFRIDQSRLLR